MYSDIGAATIGFSLLLGTESAPVEDIACTASGTDTSIFYVEPIAVAAIYTPSVLTRLFLSPTSLLKTSIG